MCSWYYIRLRCVKFLLRCSCTASASSSLSCNNQKFGIMAAFGFRNVYMNNQQSVQIVLPDTVLNTDVYLLSVPRPMLQQLFITYLAPCVVFGWTLIFVHFIYKVVTKYCLEYCSHYCISIHNYKIYLKALVTAAYELTQVYIIVLIYVIQKWL